jgi:hypothetical protein
MWNRPSKFPLEECNLDDYYTRPYLASSIETTNNLSTQQDTIFPSTRLIRSTRFINLEIIHRAAKSHARLMPMTTQSVRRWPTTVLPRCHQMYLHMPSFGSHTIGITAQSLIHKHFQRAFAPKREWREMLSSHKHSAALLLHSTVIPSASARLSDFLCSRG